MNKSENKEPSKKFPIVFFAGVALTIIVLVSIVTFGYNIKPRNTFPDCMSQCAGSDNPAACNDFCDCIHKQGNSLDSCLNKYNKASR